MNFPKYTELTQTEELIAKLNTFGKPVVLDFETTSKDPHVAELIDIQLSGAVDGEVVVLPSSHLPLLSKLTTPQVWWNFKYDWKVAYRHGLDFRKTCTELHDGMLIHHLLNENVSHSLNSIVIELYQDTYKEEFWGKYKSYLEAPEEERLVYGCKDILYTDRIFKLFSDRLLAGEINRNLVIHAHRLALALYDTEIAGIKVDMDYLIQKGTELSCKLELLKPEMRALADVEIDRVELENWNRELEKRKTEKGKANVKRPEFSFDSSKQLIDLLYHKLELTPQTNEKTKNPSVDDASLEKIKAEHPIVEKLQDYRGTNKTYTAFIEGTLDRVREGRIYPEFNVNGTATGRISHKNPNLGQLPSKGGIRGIYVPDNERRILSADYGQLEVCLAAHFSRDENLLKIVNEGASQHDITAAALGIPRAQAKTLNFAMQYRCSAFKVSKILEVSQKAGEEIWNKYWKTYSGLKQLMDSCDNLVNRGEPVVSPFGRKRRFEKTTRQPWDKAYRQAFNALIQGTGGDLTSRAFYIIHERLKEGNTGRGLWTVHDEILIEVNKDTVEFWRKELKRVMLFVGQEIELTVPLTVEVSEGQTRWED